MKNKLSLNNLNAISGGVITMQGIENVNPDAGIDFDNFKYGTAKIDFDNFKLSDSNPNDKFQLIQKNDGSYIMTFRDTSSNDPGVAFDIDKNGVFTREYSQSMSAGMPGKYILVGFDSYDADTKTATLSL
jgi:hypothetical protein